MLRILVLVLALVQTCISSAQYIDTVKVGTSRTYQALGACQNSLFIWKYNSQTIDTKEDSITIVWDKVGVYDLGVTEISQAGCQGETKEGKILVLDDTYFPINIDSIAIPNVFTPNGDGRNDEFYISIASEVQVQCSIFNRWGGLIHSSSDAAHLWNGKYKGKISDEGYYYYVLDLVYKTAKRSRTGFISLQH